MYCKQCGKENKPGNHYCHSCGMNLHSYHISNTSFERKHSAFCNQCGAKLSNQYCSECGRTADTYIVTNKSISFDVGSVKDHTKNLFKRENFTVENIKKFFLEDKNFWKEAAVGAGIALIVGLFLCFVLDIALFKDMKEGINKVYQQAESLGPSVKLKVKPNAIDLYQFSMQTPFKINYKGNFGKAAIDHMAFSFKVAFLILLLIPGIAFLVGSFRKYKEDKSTQANLKYYCGTALIFSLILNIVSLFNHKIISGSNNTLFNIEMELKGGFSFFQGFFGVFLIAFIIQCILSFIIKKERILAIGEGIPFSKSISVFVWTAKWLLLYSGALVIVIYLFSVFGLLGVEIAEIMRNSKSLLFIPTLWGYGLLGIFGNGFSIEAGDSLIKFGSFKITTEGIPFMPIDRPYAFVGFNILVILGSAVILYLGFRLLKDEKDWRVSAVAAGMLGIWNLLIALLTRSYMNIQGNFDSVGEIFSLLDMNIPGLLQGEMWFGYSPIWVFINILIWSTLFGLWKHFGESKIDVHAIEAHIVKYFRVYLSGGGILLVVMMIFGFRGIFAEPDQNIRTNGIASDQKAISVFGDRDRSQGDRLFEIDEVETIFFGNNNTYFIKTYNQVYKYEPKKSHILSIYESDGEINFIDVTKNFKKIALYERNYEGSQVVIIDEKGKELNKKPFEDLQRMQWNPNGEMLLLEGRTHQMMFPKEADNEMIEIGGNNLIWTDESTIAYIDNNQVYAYDYQSKAKKDLDQTAEFLWDGGSKVLGVNYEDIEIENEDGSIDFTNKISIDSVDGKISEEFTNESVVNYIVTDNGIKYIEKYSHDKGYSLVTHNGTDIEALGYGTGYILDLSDKDNKMIVRNMNTGDYFVYHTDTNEWDNITMDLTYSLLQRKEGANK